MSIIERIDPNSGAILFKKDQESKDLEKALKVVEDLSKRVEELEAKLNTKESK